MTERKSNTKSKDFYVYLHRKATTGEVFYVGKGFGCRAFVKETGRNKHWKNIVAKYGYTIEFYATGLQEWYAHELEIELIAYYGRENLCNMTDGGEGCKGRKHTACAKEKIRLSKSFIEVSKATRDASALSLSKNVFCSNGMDFKSISSAIKWLKSIGFEKSRDSAISAVCKNKKKSAYGYTWAYKKEDIKQIGFRNNRIVCSNGMVFDGVGCAQRWLISVGYDLASVGNISNACLGNRKFAYGLSWSYEK